ncbi:TerB family tellurite resistance protein [Qingshengfaniella alkalisoli]|uniref:TerB family tellurite resistance protein n=1 Tax=Qingshengfaniella alkalisoli TaxID=2599296 RepID=A0A5B8ITP6_9RHOB|nr:TerB family tellurite resistance protein [Qingshengfaniella alkalisoli]QDY69592.1 TerB family tellurite resistance protein [Qingshengfaniella alkalisoli]
MFAGLLKNLLSEDTGSLDPTDASLAMSALLVRVARSDGDYSAEERRRIDRILAARYALSPFEATKLRSDAETLEGEAPDTVRFTRAIKDAVPYEERTAVIEALWSVVLADGMRDEEEDSLLRMVAHFLGVNDRDSNLARLRVEGATNSSNWHETRS